MGLRKTMKKPESFMKELLIWAIHMVIKSIIIVKESKLIAMSNLAYFYTHGLGVEKDYKKAKIYYLRAGNLGVSGGFMLLFLFL